MYSADFHQVHATLHAQEEHIQHHEEELSTVGRGMRTRTSSQPSAVRLVISVTSFNSWWGSLTLCFLPLLLPVPQSLLPHLLCFPLGSSQSMSFSSPSLYSVVSTSSYRRVFSYWVVQCSLYDHLPLWQSWSMCRGWMGKRLIVCQSQALFSETLSKIFDYPTPGEEVAQALVGFTPGKMQSDW